MARLVIGTFAQACTVLKFSVIHGESAKIPSRDLYSWPMVS
ncbi:hypothetical protein N9Y48_05195 [Zobellia sp.]|nr:hypothetical protein [Zobellia sp.]